MTLFPEMVAPTLGHSIWARAVAKGAVEFRTVNPRDFALDRHKSVDDSPYGGGPGMVMMPHLIEQSLESLELAPDASIILTDPMGEKFSQSAARSLAVEREVVFICGHYEGVDERVRTQLATHAYSIGDYVLTGGELPSLVMADSIIRLLPDVLGDPQSHLDDSFEDSLLGFPLYTKPAVFRDHAVPEVLTSGDHKKISAWRRKQQLLRTRQFRPDLFAMARLSRQDLKLLSED